MKINDFDNLDKAVEFFCETEEATAVKFEFTQPSGKLDCFFLKFTMKKDGIGIDFTVMANPCPFDLIEEKINLITKMCNDYIRRENDAWWNYENLPHHTLPSEAVIDEVAEYGRQQLSAQTNMLPHLED
jgi:hypothetical protein